MSVTRGFAFKNNIEIGAMFTFNLYVNYVAGNKSKDISQIDNYFSETVKLRETGL